MHNFDRYYPSQKGCVCYIRELTSLPILVVVNWGQSSPRRSSNSICTLIAAVIYCWECAEIKLQLPQTI